VLNTHLNALVAKTTDWKWLFTPTNKPKGILYRFVR
jgi:hypothetical protein